MPILLFNGYGIIARNRSEYSHVQHDNQTVFSIETVVDTGPVGRVAGHRAIGPGRYQYPPHG